MALLKKLVSLISRQAEHWAAFTIKDEKTELATIAPHEGYLRLWVTDMYVTHDREWFRSKVPSVKASLQLNFGDQPQVKFSKITRAPEEVIIKGAFNDFAVTDLIPYSGGLVQIGASLFTLNGPSELGTTIDILQGFSGLVSAPFGQVLSIARQVNDGIDKFLDAVNGDVQLAYERTFSSEGGGGENILTPGYIAVIGAPMKTLDQSRFAVKNSKLLYFTHFGIGPEPFEEKDYMLFRIEGRAERDDWSKLKNIEDNKNEAIKAVLRRETEKATTLKRATIIAVYESPDLVQNDKKRVTKAIIDEFKDLEEAGLGAAAEEPKSLAEVMKSRWMSIQVAKTKPFSLKEALAQIE
jgi:hypothetical protein